MSIEVKNDKSFAIFDTDQVMLDLLKEMFEMEGYQPVITDIHQLESGRVNLDKMLQEQTSIVAFWWNISKPKDISLHHLKSLINSKYREDRKIIATTILREEMTDFKNATGLQIEDISDVLAMNNFAKIIKENEK